MFRGLKATCLQLILCNGVVVLLLLYFKTSAINSSLFKVELSVSASIPYNAPETNDKPKLMGQRKAINAQRKPESNPSNHKSMKQKTDLNEHKLTTNFKNIMPTLKMNHRNPGSNALRSDKWSDEKRSVLKKKESNLPRNILIWNLSKWMKKILPRDMKTAPSKYGGCSFTMDRRKQNESLAVVIFHKQTVDLPDPKTRKPWQNYVFWSVETQSKMFYYEKFLKQPRFDGIFNLTITPTRRADVQMIFGNHYLALQSSKALNKSGELERDLMVKGKSNKSAIWYVSNCFSLYGSIHRMIFVRELVKAGLNLDKFGECFENATKTAGMVLDKKSHLSSAPYKFYLAFENSIHCPDYVTEKFWRNSLNEGLVPIVWGPTREDVRDIAPPHSYIHCDDYKTPLELVTYIKYLERNHTAYMEYHAWRYVTLDSITKPEVTGEPMNALHRLCKRIVLEKHQVQIIPSIWRWYFKEGYTDNQCLRHHRDAPNYNKSELMNF